MISPINSAASGYSIIHLVIRRLDRGRRGCRDVWTVAGTQSFNPGLDAGTGLAIEFL